MRSLLLTALLLTCSAYADDLTPENMAKIQNEQAKANEAIDKKYGNKKPSELSADDRRQMMKDKSAAEREVLEKHGTDPKSFARASSKMSRDDRAATDSATKDLQKKDADAAAAGGADAKKTGGKKEIVIEKNGKSAGGPDDDANEAAKMDKQNGLGRGKK